MLHEQRGKGWLWGRGSSWKPGQASGVNCRDLVQVGKALLPLPLISSASHDLWMNRIKQDRGLLDALGKLLEKQWTSEGKLTGCLVGGG